MKGLVLCGLLLSAIGGRAQQEHGAAVLVVATKTFTMVSTDSRASSETGVRDDQCNVQLGPRALAVEAGLYFQEESSVHALSVRDALAADQDLATAEAAQHKAATDLLEMIGRHYPRMHAAPSERLQTTIYAVRLRTGQTLVREVTITRVGRVVNESATVDTKPEGENLLRPAGHAGMLAFEELSQQTTVRSKAQRPLYEQLLTATDSATLAMLSRRFIQLAAEWEQPAEGEPSTVGGVVHSAMLTKTGARWLNPKDTCKRR